MRVLVVDDEAAVRTAARVMLEGLGHEVAEAADGRAAVRALGAAPADVILCDVFMPGRDGLELLRELRPAASGARVIAMSGGGEFHGRVDLLPLAEGLGARGVLYKPFTARALRAAIQTALGDPLPAS